MQYTNVFGQTKEYYQTAFSNMERFQSENEKLVKIFMDRLENMDPSIAKNYSEWTEIVQKGFADFQDLVLKGLDYLSENMDKNANIPLTEAS